MGRTQTIASMTHEELQALILTLINEQLHGWPFQPQRTGLHTPDVWQMILDGIIEPAPGEPSALDMLREERDQWYKISRRYERFDSGIHP